MSQPDLLSEVVQTLKGLGIEHMLTGSHASSLQGEARATHDIDLVAKLDLNQADSLYAAFNMDRFYLSQSAMTEAIRSKRMFNLLETTMAEKVDFWVLTDSPFDQSRFRRRQPFDLGELIVDVSTPEDTMLMKLLWCKQSGGSEKQINDVLRIYELQLNMLDLSYIHHWVVELGVEPLWQRVLDEGEPFVPKSPYDN